MLLPFFLIAFLCSLLCRTGFNLRLSFFFKVQKVQDVIIWAEFNLKLSSFDNLATSKKSQFLSIEVRLKIKIFLSQTFSTWRLALVSASLIISLSHNPFLIRAGFISVTIPRSGGGRSWSRFVAIPFYVGQVSSWCLCCTSDLWRRFSRNPFLCRVGFIIARNTAVSRIQSCYCRNPFLCRAGFILWNI